MPGVRRPSDVIAAQTIFEMQLLGQDQVEPDTVWALLTVAVSDSLKVIIRFRAGSGWCR